MLSSRRRRLVATVTVAALAVAAIVPAAAQVAVQFCNAPNACYKWSNSGTGEGLAGTSASGTGTYGSTTFDSRGQPKGQSGVEGDDFDTHGFFNSGVTGTSIHGAGVSAISQTGDGIDAASNKHWGGHFTSVGFGGIYADSKQGTGVVAIAEGPGPAASLTAVGSGPLLIGYNRSNVVAQLDQTGNLSIAGVLTQGAALQTKARASDGSRVDMYAAQQPMRTVEDVGQAYLANGAVSVQLDPQFAKTMANSDYLVFLTAEGDNRGLFVAAKRARGFQIREAQNGRSRLAVDYRIVARPYAANTAP